jgi:methionyl aminopeptidase
MDEETIDRYRRAGKAAAAGLKFGAGLIRPGASILEVVDRTEQHILDQGPDVGLAFPVNIALDDVAAHFTPLSTDRGLKFERGQLVKLDCGAHVDGLIGDTAATVEVGTRNYTDLVRASKEALEVALDMIAPKVRLNSVGDAVSGVIKGYGFAPIENLTGHSLEPFNLHAGLSVPNVPDPRAGVVQAGTALAIEPFATDGRGRVTGKKPSHIFRFQRGGRGKGDDARRLLNDIDDRFHGLPFAERWCTPLTRRAAPALRQLVRAGGVTEYPILAEVGNGIVSQAEHTLLVLDGGNEITTLR